MSEAESADYFRQKAEQCRRLAEGIGDAKAVTALLAMAVEFEAKAVAAGAQEVSERQTAEVSGPPPHDGHDKGGG